MATYTMVYTGETTTLSLGQFEAAMSAVAVDTTIVDALEITLFSDTVAPVDASHASRTFVYKSTVVPAPVPDPEVAQVLTNLYTAQLARALSVPIDADDVVVT